MRQHIDSYRTHAATLRRLDNAEPTTRNHAARERQVARVEAAMRSIETSLIESGSTGRALIGALVAEKTLMGRLAQARRLQQTRPELRIRLATVRRQITATA